MCRNVVRLAVGAEDSRSCSYLMGTPWGLHGVSSFPPRSNDCLLLPLSSQSLGLPWLHMSAPKILQVQNSHANRQHLHHWAWWYGPAILARRLRQENKSKALMSSTVSSGSVWTMRLPRQNSQSKGSWGHGWQQSTYLAIISIAIILKQFRYFTLRTMDE